MTDIKSEISQKELFKQYLASRSKLDKQMPVELIKKYEHKQEINKQYNNKLKQRYIDDLEYKKKRLENQKKYYYEKKKPKNEELKKLKLKELEQPEAQPEPEPEAQPQPQIEEKRQSKKMNDLHNLFNRHLFV